MTKKTENKTEWTELANKELRGRPLDDLKWQTPEGIEVQPVYTSDDAEGLEHMGGMPGSAPSTLGPRAPM